MKKILTFSLTVLATLGVGAQSRLSSTITDMLSSVQQQIAEAQSMPKAMSLNSTTSQECPVDTAAIKKKMVASFNADGTLRTIDVIAELAEGATCPTSALTAKGISVNGEALGFVFLTVPAEMLEYLETIEEFVSLEADNINQPYNDNSRILLNVSDINGIDKEEYAFEAPFTGKDIVVGIIDTGIDYNHVSFKDSEGNTRIKKAINYATTGNSYTTATTAEQIAALTHDSASGTDPSHGTHVACSAAGSKVLSKVDYSLGSRNLMGMAPEADLVLCGVHNFSDSKVTTCLSQIIATADELNKPCVINMSFGRVGDWHHGTTVSKAIDNAVKAGVVVCMSTGNEALYNWSVDKTFATDDYLTIIPTKTGSVASSNRSYLPNQTISFFLPQCSDNTAVEYSFEVVDSLTGEVTTLAATPLKAKATSTQINPSISFTTDSGTGWLKGTFSLSASYFDENSKFLVVKMKNVSGADMRIYVMSNLTDKDCLASTDFPNYTYDKGTADMSINNSCSTENIISVGSYTRSKSFKSYNMPEGKQYSFNVKDVGEENSTSAFSSYGKDDYGKAYPDVIAPGVAVISAYNYYDTSKATVSDHDTWSAHIAAYYAENNNKMNLWYVNNGTSMATPITTGIVALWMQACRHYAPEHGDLTTADVHEIIVNTSRTAVEGNDIKITAGNTPQNYLQLGNGLIDAKAGIQYIIDNFANPTGIKVLSEDDTETAKNHSKTLINGKIIIAKNGKQYNAAGQLVR